VPVLALAGALGRSVAGDVRLAAHVEVDRRVRNIDLIGQMTGPALASGADSLLVLSDHASNGVHSAIRFGPASAIGDTHPYSSSLQPYAAVPSSDPLRGLRPRGAAGASRVRVRPCLHQRSRSGESESLGPGARLTEQARSP
jgi:hypothetical protein